MKKVAVIVYVPDQPVYVRQFLALYCSAMMHPALRSMIDFVVGCPPSIRHALDLDNVVITPCSQLSLDPGYQFRLIFLFSRPGCE